MEAEGLAAASTYPDVYVAFESHAPASAGVTVNVGPNKSGIMPSPKPWGKIMCHGDRRIDRRGINGRVGRGSRFERIRKIVVVRIDLSVLEETTYTGQDAKNMVGGA